MVYKMVRWEDFKADAIELFKEFKRHKIGWVGVGIIAFLVIISLLAPVIAGGIPDDWRAGADRWRGNPAQSPPVWMDWITRDDYARQEEILEWDDYEFREAVRDAPTEADLEVSRLFHEAGVRQVNLSVEEDGELKTLGDASLDVNVAEREGKEYINVTEFSVSYDEADLEHPPAEVEINAELEHEGVFEAGGAERKEFTLDRTRFSELEPSPEEGEISDELTDELIEGLDYLEEGDLDDAELSEESENDEEEWYVNVDGERLVRIEQPEEYAFDMEVDEEYLEDGYIRPAFRREFEEKYGEYLFNFTADEYELEDGEILPEELREQFPTAIHENASFLEQDGIWWVTEEERRSYRIDVEDGIKNVYEPETLDNFALNLEDKDEFPLEEGPISEELRENITEAGHELPAESELVHVDGEEWRIVVDIDIVDKWGRHIEEFEEAQFRIEETESMLQIYEFGSEIYEEHGTNWITAGDGAEYRVEEGEVLDVGETEVYGKYIEEISLDMPEGEEIDEDVYTSEWTLEPEEKVEDIEIFHTFRFDGHYGIHLGEHSEFFVLGVGNDIIVDSLDITEIDADEMRYNAEVDLISLVGTTREIQIRVERLVDEEWHPVEGGQHIWEVGPYEEITEDWEFNFDIPGEYAFVIGEEEETLDLTEDEEEDDPETASRSSLSSSEEESIDTASAGDNITVETFAIDPDEITQGERATITIELKNTGGEEEEVMLTVDDEEFRRIVLAPGGDIDRHTFSFTYDMQYDRLPREMYFFLSGHSDRYNRRMIEIERPDSQEQVNDDFPALEDQRPYIFYDNNGQLRLEIADRGDAVGEFEDRVTLYRRMGVRQQLHSDADTYLSHSLSTPEYENLTILDHMVTDPFEIIFGQANENWLSGDPDPLQGEYTINVTLEGQNLELDEDDTKIDIGGAVYGVLGTDRQGRDLFLGWIWGARYGLYAGGIVALATIAFSTTYGMTSAYYGGWVDEMMSRIQEILMGIPTLPILIILLRFWSRSINVFVLVYALLAWRGAARVIRARGLQVAQDTYIEAAESLGSGSSRIIFKHMIPEILPYSIAQAALMVPVVIMAEAGMHILGLGDPNVVTWGTILDEARRADALLDYERSWFWILFPGLGMALVGFGFISTGMAIERIINPEMQQR